MKTNKSLFSLLLVPGILAILIGIIYGRVMSYGFISYDDLALLPGNPDRALWDSLQVIPWAFTNFTLQDWMPVTWVSLLLDYHLFGFNPGAFHFTNVLLYFLSVLFLFFVLRRVTGDETSSFWIACLFAVHPLHVESVAWISQRKEMVSSLFWMLTLWSYVCYSESQNDGRDSRVGYVRTLILFALGLMSKPTLVTLPLVLLLFDYWPLRRVESASKLKWVEKLPFIALSVISCVMTMAAVSAGDTGSVRSIEELSMASRLSNALVSYVLYLWKTLFPYPLHFLYSQQEAFKLWHVIGAAILLGAITLASIRLRKKRPYLFVGWSWFLIVMLPMIGFVQVGSHAMTDRYAYFPHIGLFILVVFGLRDLTRAFWSKAFVFISLALMIIYTLLAWRQSGYWRDSETLYKQTLKHDPRNYYIQEALCEELFHQARYEEANTHCAAAVEVDPERAKAYQTLGRGYFKQQKYREAQQHLSKYLDLIVDLRTELASDKTKYLQEFKRSYEQITQSPEDGQGFYVLGNLWANTKDYLLAVDAYREAIERAPRNGAFHTNIANVYFLMGEMSSAEKHYKLGAELDAGNVNAHYNYGLFLSALGRDKEARERYQRVLTIAPDHVGAKKKTLS